MENKPFYIKDYSNAVKYANENNLSIIEINADEQGRRFILQDNIITKKDINIGEIIDLKNWFNTYYTIHEQKYRRLYALKLYCEDGTHPYDNLLALYDEAERKRRRIQELEGLIDNE